jgi:hypothetical protein
MEPRTGRPGDVSAGARDVSGAAVSASAMQRLRTGTNTTSKTQTTWTPAGFSGASPDYFHDEVETEPQLAEIEVVAAVSDQNVRCVVPRLNGLSTSILPMLNSVISRNIQAWLKSSASAAELLFSGLRYQVA